MAGIAARLFEKLVKLLRADWRIGTAAIVVALYAVYCWNSSGVREIRNADGIANFAIVDPHPGSDDWPWWHGTDGRNATGSDQVLSDWTSSNRSGWRVPITGNSHSVPCIWGSQAFVLTREQNRQSVSLRSIHRTSGDDNWRVDLRHGSVDTTPTLPPISSSPASDGQFVFAACGVHGSVVVTAVDLKGRIAWQHRAGPFQATGCRYFSPVLYKSLVIVACDQAQNSFIAALHRQTGEVIWRIKRPDGESFGTPVVAISSGRAQLVVAGKGTVNSYDPANGNLLWTFQWPANSVANSVAFDSERIFATYQKPEPEIVCIKSDGSGDVTASHVVWRRAKTGSDTISPVRHADLVYLLSPTGQLTCFHAETGKIEYRKPLEGTYLASPLIAGDNLICVSESGSVTILKTGLTGTIFVRNQLPEGITGSPVAAGNALFLRTTGGLQCISPRESPPVAEKPPTNRRRT